MRVLGVVQARMGSTRLPGKALLPLGGKPMTVAVLDRMAMATTMKHVVAAIPDNAANDELKLRILAGGYYPVIRGPEDDLWTRFVRVLDAYQDVEAVVRVTGDEPLVDPEAIDAVVATWLLAPHLHFVHNCWKGPGTSQARTWPDGSDVELMRADVIRHEATQFTSRLVAFNTYQQAYVERPQGRFPYGGLQWSVDTEADYRGAMRVYEELGPTATTDAIVRHFDAHSLAVLGR